MKKQLSLRRAELIDDVSASNSRQESTGLSVLTGEFDQDRNGLGQADFGKDNTVKVRPDLWKDWEHLSGCRLRLGVQV